MKTMLGTIFKIVFYGWNAVMLAVVVILIWNQMSGEFHADTFAAGSTVIAVVMTGVIWAIGSVIFGALARVSSPR
jgi:hypothetical protein